MQKVNFSLLHVHYYMLEVKTEQSCNLPLHSCFNRVICLVLSSASSPVHRGLQLVFEKRLVVTT